MKTAATIAALILSLAFAHAARATQPGFPLSWTFPTHNEDGTPLTDLAGAKIYYGTASSNYTHVVEFPGGEPGQTVTNRLTMAEHGLTPGVMYYLNGTAYNTAGLESDFTLEVQKTFLLLPTPDGLTLIEDGEPGTVWRRVIRLKDGRYESTWEVEPHP